MESLKHLLSHVNMKRMLNLSRVGGHPSQTFWFGKKVMMVFDFVRSSRKTTTNKTHLEKNRTILEEENEWNRTQIGKFFFFFSGTNLHRRIVKVQTQMSFSIFTERVWNSACVYFVKDSDPSTQRVYKAVRDWHVEDCASLTCIDRK